MIKLIDRTDVRPLTPEEIDSWQQGYREAGKPEYADGWARLLVTHEPVVNIDGTGNIFWRKKAE